MKEIKPPALSYVGKIITCEKCNRSFQIEENDALLNVKNEVSGGGILGDRVWYELSFKLPCCGRFFDVKDIAL